MTMLSRTASTTSLVTARISMICRKRSIRVKRRWISRKLGSLHLPKQMHLPADDALVAHGRGVQIVAGIVPVCRTSLVRQWRRQTADARIDERGDVARGGGYDRRPRRADRVLRRPAEHWIHLRTTNPIEATFATPRLRSRVTKQPGSRASGVAMAFKLIASAQAHERSVNASHMVALVRAGATSENGNLVERPDESRGDQQAASPGRP